MGRTDTEEYANWEEGFERGIEHLIKQVKGELAFLNSQAIKYLVHEADFGACHANCPSIENRKKKLKKQLKEVEERLL